jgi:hypothetical protein
MAWQQLRQPNLDPYIVQPNEHGGIYTLTDWYGWCLAYVQTALGTGWGGNYAWDCWNNHTVNKHDDRNLPSGVYVPIFFSGYHGQGHTAIYKDGEVWSSPITHKPYADTWGSIAEVERSYGVTFVGWAEGMGGTTVIQWHDDAPAIPMVTLDQLTQLYNDYLTRSPDQSGIDTYVGKVPYDQVKADILASPEYLALIAPKPEPAPYVPPAAPVVVAKAERYITLTTLPYYATLEAVQNPKTEAGTLPVGKYYVWEKGGSNSTYYNLTDDNTKNQNKWINILSNKTPLNPPVLSTPMQKPVEIPLSSVSSKPSQVPIAAENDSTWKASYKSFHTDRHSETYQLVQNWNMREYSGKRKVVPLYTGNKVNIVGTFTKNGVTFYRPRANNDEYFSWFYGIPQVDDTGNAVLVKQPTEIESVEKRFSDYLHYWKSDIKDIMDIFFRKKK